jgi:hypothetical protein
MNMVGLDLIQLQGWAAAGKPRETCHIQYIEEKAKRS